jgi:raffinose/stachyose/melibiose transport system permease protein
MNLFRYTWKTFTRELVLLAIAAIFLIPIYVLAVLSLKSSESALTAPLAPFSHLSTSNFSAAWPGASGVSMATGLKSSAIITVGSVVLLIVFGSLTAYAIARRPSKLTSGLYGMFVLGIIIPFQLGVVPLYVAMKHLHLVGSYIGMILLETGLMMPLAVFLYTGFIRVLPRDYEEAALVDGASFFRTFFRVIFPLLRPVSGTVAVLTGIVIWNDFFNPLIFLSGSNHATLPVVLYSFVGDFSSQWNLIFAAVIIALAPMLIFYVFAQRQLIRGFSGGIRG